MFERFTNRARTVMQLANVHAQSFNQDYIMPENVLAGLIKEGTGTACYLLAQAEIELLKLLLDLEACMQREPPPMGRSEKLPFIPATKWVLEYANEEARTLNHNYVGTEHLLLGLVRRTDVVPAKLLADRGITLKPTRSAIIAHLGDYADKPSRTLSEAEQRSREQKLAGVLQKPNPSVSHRALALWFGQLCELAQVPLSPTLLVQLSDRPYVQILVTVVKEANKHRLQD